MKKECDSWKRLWARDHQQLEEARERIDSIRRSMWAQPLPEQLKLTTTRLKAVVRATKLNAGKGPDNVSKAFATQLPEKGWQQLTAVLQATLGLGIVPIQLSHAWIALLAKPAEAGDQ